MQPKWTLVSIMVVIGVLMPATTSLGTSGTLSITADTVLTEDHTGLIDIVNDGVTLDCAGYSVIGTPGDTSGGIRVVERTGVTVRNCHVTGFDGLDPFPGAGFVVRLSSGITLENNSADGNGLGYLISGTHDSTFRGNTAIDSLEQGLLLQGLSSGNLLEANSTINSGRAFEIKAPGNTLWNNTSTNDDIGFWIREGAVGNLLDGNTASNNDSTGFLLDSSGVSGNTLSHNIATGNPEGYRDETSGSGDLGTDNFYFDNACVGNTVSSTPPGLCGRFADDDSGPFEDDTEWMAEQGITLGCNPEGTLYCTGDPVTRAQMASFLARALDLPPVAGNRFADVSGTHTANINALAEAGVTLGCNAEGTFYCPNDLVTRAQMGSFLARALDLAPIPGDRFADVSGSHEPNINAIADAGITLGCNPEGTLYCPNDNVTRGQMAAFLHRALG